MVAASNLGVVRARFVSRLVLAGVKWSVNQIVIFSARVGRGVQLASFLLNLSRRQNLYPLAYTLPPAKCRSA